QVPVAPRSSRAHAEAPGAGRPPGERVGCGHTTVNAMECEETQLVLDEWVRGIIGESESSEAREHASGCAACGRFVEMSRALSEGLEAWAREESTLGASPRVEKALRAAFRQKSARR